MAGRAVMHRSVTCFAQTGEKRKKFDRSVCFVLYVRPAPTPTWTPFNRRKRVIRFLVSPGETFTPINYQECMLTH